MSFVPTLTANITQIDPDICAGNTLSTINNNFTLLDYKLSSISLSADVYWNTLYTVAQAASASWDNLTNIIQSNSGAWNSAYTAMTAYSACWLKPITLIFPNVVDTQDLDLASHITNVSSWLNENFPVTSLAGTAISYNYCAGQELYIFTMGYETENQVIIPDSSRIVGVCAAENLAWSWSHCSIKAGCTRIHGNIAFAGSDLDLLGNPLDDGSTLVSPSNNISFKLKASVVGIDTLNTSVINYRPSLFEQGYFKFINNTGNHWVYTGLRSLSS